MPNLIPIPIRAIKRAADGARTVYRQGQRRSHDGAAPVTPTSPETESTAPDLPDVLSRSEQDLRRCAWNGSIGDGLLRKIHRERLGTVAAARMANAVQYSALSNRLAALEAELSVLVEQPPKPAPQPKVLKIDPARKGA